MRHTETRQMRANTLRILPGTGKPIVNAWLSIPSPFAAEVLGQPDFDAATVAMQHA